MSFRRVTAALFAFALVSFRPAPAPAHCDGRDGPVVAAAQKALQTGNVNLVLVWVRPADEPEIRAAFSHTLAVRKINAQARALADDFFFETLVRVHRAGEGAPFTGLKPAGRDLGPAIPAADDALRTGKPDALLALIAGETRDGLEKRFQEALAAKSYDPDDVAAGRRYVEAYVTFVHYVERLHEDATRAPEGHFAEHEDGGAPPHED